MRQSLYSGVLALSLSFSAGCGTTVHPRVGTGEPEPPIGRLPGTGPTLRPTPGAGVLDEATPLIDEICRSQGMRTGWIATRYFKDVGNCPESTDPDNPYTAAVIERYSLKPIGATMVVCADQSIPRDWVREHNQDVRQTCQGARVRDGAPTVMVIRRVYDRR